jgi:hypothetical protein
MLYCTMHMPVKWNRAYRKVYSVHVSLERTRLYYMYCISAAYRSCVSDRVKTNTYLKLIVMCLEEGRRRGGGRWREGRGEGGGVFDPKFLFVDSLFVLGIFCPIVF